MNLTDPSLRCDCRSKSIRNVRIVAALAFVCALVVREAAFAYGSAAHAALGITVGAAILVYGVATLFDETATFPKWLYGLFAVIGGLLAANAIFRLL